MASARLVPAVHYTGFVVGQRPEPNHTTSAPRGPILVSAGGGLYGAPLFKTAIAAHALLTKKEKAKLKIVAGPFLPDREWEALRAAAGSRQGIQLTRSVPDLFGELRGASASISQCGYNTALEIMQAGVPALVVPFADGGEDEQMKRARRLEQLGAVRVLDQNEMTLGRMADEMGALVNFHPQTPRLELNGGQRSAEILDTLMRARNVAATQAQRAKEMSGWQV